MHTHILSCTAPEPERQDAVREVEMEGMLGGEERVGERGQDEGQDGNIGGELREVEVTVAEVLEGAEERGQDEEQDGNIGGELGEVEVAEEEVLDRLVSLMEDLEPTVQGDLVLDLSLDLLDNLDLSNI